MSKRISKKKQTKRNDSLFDKWSLVHFVASAAIAHTLGPIPALILTTAWEPIEIFIVSPIMDKFGILFGHETLKNSLSDISFNTLGILAASALL